MWSLASVDLWLSLLYTCQLSRLRRESHACGLETSISRRLTLVGQFLTPDWKMWVAAVLLDTISKNMLIRTHVRNEHHCVKWINDNAFLDSVIFEVKGTGSELAFIRVLRLGLGFRTTSDFFGNLRKWSCRLQKSQHSQDKNLTRISRKKLGRYTCTSVHLNTLLKLKY